MSTDRLDSWKAISDYLGRDVRTVQRWERERQLLVHRVPGAGRGVVFAFKPEIDTWLAAPDTLAEVAVAGAPEPRPRPGRRVARLAWLAAVAAVSAVAIWSWPFAVDLASVRPVQVEVTPIDVRAKDAVGTDLWQWRFPVEGRPAVQARGDVSEIDGDVFAGAESFYRGTANGATPVGGRVWRISASGQTRWEHSADGTVVQYGDASYRSPWILRDLLLTARPDGRRLVVAWTHDLWWPSFLEVLDEDRHIRAVFHNPGWIRGSGWLPQVPDRLVASGTSNPHDAAMVALIDTSHHVTTAPPPEDSAFRCGNCGTKPPLKYVVFPRSEVNRVTGAFVNYGVPQVRDGRITVRTQESDRADPLAGAEVVYEFDEALRLRRVTYSDRYWEIHATLERDGRLSHTRAECPERAGPPGIREWTPSEGWRPATIVGR